MGPTDGVFGWGVEKPGQAFMLEDMHDSQALNIPYTQSHEAGHSCPCDADCRSSTEAGKQEMEVINSSDSLSLCIIFRLHIVTLTYDRLIL